VIVAFFTVKGTNHVNAAGFLRRQPPYPALDPGFAPGPDRTDASISALAQAEALPSWNDGPTKTSIVNFVARVTTQGGPDFVPAEQRIATFDNDARCGASSRCMSSSPSRSTASRPWLPASGVEGQAALQGGA